MDSDHYQHSYSNTTVSKYRCRTHFSIILPYQGADFLCVEAMPNPSTTPNSFLGNPLNLPVCSSSKEGVGCLSCHTLLSYQNCPTSV
ncbi:hypothetical protein XELAEV_18023952mg [Xenopus laevis]|uniref:Uncharacterized protein n=1 Tax=Xenopus laevis TaxID=8355 RepID=A0A974D7J7_XENLA|nr:hypothetical protein XELAEV_18023952mg [Xenopus laevis]